ncbi:hypothetical protein CLAFUW4_13347 [Fulvia fulva]|uniref:Uncharacterized protein n=1 Tax=Passalora fulva TaxID=5499 RepID=A0A9Q8PJJ5_PASFU|nr:uncharacterized protein CLAFUR5_13202 [Fulvia fulva]KAK4611710.1 hypothetical protein CLAFUR4_13351 [Fulvia fulva]KAK4613032.1 hypothetical protein CLAFUR0_13357 [Fulvia fulva]UJO23623.1 hypothetical protein CLAFUR5_13202 [Fulvia fulva]WPV21382.1 hypothetical protein CLAFUW4_13347 [Fulvia fulva]WPV35932.1 hypothetical protein CLAFUW7_13354 [Fulvia fulva]
MTDQPPAVRVAHNTPQGVDCNAQAPTRQSLEQEKARLENQIMLGHGMKHSYESLAGRSPERRKRDEKILAIKMVTGNKRV